MVGRWADDLAGVQVRLRRLDRIAESHGLRIGDDGAVEPADGLAGGIAPVITGVVDGDDAEGDAVRADLQARETSLLAEASEIDDVCARRLLGLVDGETGGGLAGLVGQTVLSPLICPMGSGGGGGVPIPRITTPKGGGLVRFFRRLFNPGRPVETPVLPESSVDGLGQDHVPAESERQGELEHIAAARPADVMYLRVAVRLHFEELSPVTVALGGAAESGVMLGAIGAGPMGQEH